MKLVATSILILLMAVTVGCGAAAKATPQYVPVPAITGQWTIAYNNGDVGTVQVNLVSVPCGQGSEYLSCSQADNFNGLGSITGTAGTFYYPPQTLTVGSGNLGSSTTMNFSLLECSGTSTNCYANMQPCIFDAQGILTSPSNTFSGNWTYSSGPCVGQTGTFIATQE
jgi:hypothetical protein